MIIKNNVKELCHSPIAAGSTHLNLYKLSVEMRQANAQHQQQQWLQQQ